MCFCDPRPSWTFGLAKPFRLIIPIFAILSKEEGLITG